MDSATVKSLVQAEAKNLNRLFAKKGVAVREVYFDRRMVMYEFRLHTEVRADILSAMKQTVEAQAFAWRKKWGYDYEVPVTLDLGRGRYFMPLFDPTRAEPMLLTAEYLDDLAKVGSKWWAMLGFAPKVTHPKAVDRISPIYVDLDSPDFGIMVTAVSQWGKTSMMKAMLMEMCWRHDPSELKVIVIDPENKTWKDWARVPHVTAHVTDMDYATQVLRDIQELMRGPARTYTARTILLIEEFQAFTTAAKSSTLRNLFKDVMSDIMTRGAAYGYSPIVSTQRPEMRVIPGMVRDNIPVRVSGKHRSRGACDMALGAGHTEPLGLANPGDFVLVDQRGSTLFYGAMLHREKELIAQLGRKHARVFKGRPANERYREMDDEILMVLEQYDDGVELGKGWIGAVAKVLARRGGYLTHKGRKYKEWSAMAQKFADVYFMRAHPNDLPEIDETGQLIEYDDPLEYEREKRLHVFGVRRYEDIHPDTPVDDWEGEN